MVGYGAATIDDVLFETGIARADFFDKKNRGAGVVGARVIAMRRLYAAGFSKRHISMMLKCHYDTVRYWLLDGFRTRRKKSNADRNRNRTRPAIKPPTKSELYRKDLFEGLEEAGFLVGNKEAFKRPGKLSALNVIEIICLYKAGRTIKASQIAAKHGLDWHYPSAICRELQISHKHRRMHSVDELKMVSDYIALA